MNVFGSLAGTLSANLCDGAFDADDSATAWLFGTDFARRPVVIEFDLNEGRERGRFPLRAGATGALNARFSKRGDALLASGASDDDGSGPFLELWRVREGRRAWRVLPSRAAGSPASR